MNFRFCIGPAVAAVLSLAGCAVHPLPDNIEGFNTVQIVERIRCEAVKSIQQEVINLLKEQHNPLGDELQAHPDEFQHFPVSRLRDQHQIYFYHRYIKSGLALAFTFDISEDNADNSEVDLLKAITGGSVGLNLKAGSDRMRENTRTLVVSETFEHLLNDPNVCTYKEFAVERQNPFETSNHDVPNLVYPITGSIGLFEVVRTFIDLNEEGLLSKGATDKAPVLTDTLVFTTTLSGSINPQVSLAQAGGKVDLKLATLTSSVLRKDLNKVIVALSLAPEKGFDRAPLVGPFAGKLVSGDAIFARQTGDAAVQRALDAITQQRINNFYDKFSQVVVP